MSFPTPEYDVWTNFEHGGNLYRCKYTDDPDRSLMMEQGDGMWCGRIEFGHTDPISGRSWRPDEFDGRARKLTNRYGDDIWWQVPGDIPDDQIRPMANFLSDLMEFGYVGVIVESVSTCPTCSQYTNESRSIWGIESPLCGALDDGYLATTVGELVDELASAR